MLRVSEVLCDFYKAYKACSDPRMLQRGNSISSSSIFIMLAPLIIAVGLPISLVLWLIYYQIQENRRNNPAGTRRIPGPKGIVDLLRFNQSDH